MENTQINHSSLITAIENFVEDTITQNRPWDNYWIELVELLQELQEQYNPDLKYSAYNQAMIELMLELEQKLKAFQYINNSTVKRLSFRKLRRKFEKFRNNHDREVQRFKESELENRGKALEYTELLLEHYSKLAIIRVDLSYRRENRAFVDILDFRQDIRKLLDRLQDKDRHFKHLQGYVYALEQGAQKGYHAHFLVFYDGGEVQSDRYIADCMIDTWKKITDEMGIGYNCNTKENRESYKKHGNDALGQVQRGDAVKRKAILDIVRYFTKPEKTEQYLRVRVKSMPTFGHGKFKKPSRRDTEHTLQRVRSNQHFEDGYRRNRH